MFACEGIFPCSAIDDAREGLVDLLRVEPGELVLADQDDGQRREPDLHELLTRARIATHVALGERDALLRQILCRAMTGPSADVGVDGDLRRHRRSSLLCRIVTLRPRAL